MASDNSENTQKKLRDKCSFYGVELWQIEADGEALAHAVGKTGRVAVVAITDENLCRMVQGTKKKNTIE